MLSNQRSFKTMNHKPFNFLSFINRSGSTLLAKELSSLRDVTVTLEGLEHRSIGGDKFALDLRSADDIECWLDKVFSEEKFRAWKINRDELRERLLGSFFPINYNNFLSIVFDLYAEKESSSSVLYKNRGLISDLERSMLVFPDAKYVFIYRDPRGIFSSQKKSMDSLTKVPMANTIVSYAIGYKTLMGKIQRYEMDNILGGYLLAIRYEDLICNKEETINSVVRFLGIGKERVANDCYNAEIPSGQKHLHENLSKPFLKDRVNSWCDELAVDDIYFLSLVLRKEIQEYSYYSSKVNFRDCENKIELIIRVIVFVAKYHPKAIVKRFFSADAL